MYSINIGQSDSKQIINNLKCCVDVPSWIYDELRFTSERSRHMDFNDSLYQILFIHII